MSAVDGVEDGAAGVGTAGEATLARMRQQLPWQRFRLANGLVVLVHEDRREPRVRLSVSYRVGSKDESPGQTGFAHLFEHLMFGGSAHLPGPYVENLHTAGGVDVNGVTSRDLTRYYQTVPTGALDHALFAEADRMGHFAEALTQRVLDLQRQVVLMEKQETEGQPLGALNRQVGEALYPVEHPYHHPVIGSVHDIAAATLADAQDWYVRHYTPNNAVLVLAGDIDLVTAQAQVNRHFAHIPPGPPLTRFGAWIPAAPRRRRTVIEARITEPGMLLMVWHLPANDDPDSEMFGLAAALLGGGAASRLHRELVDSRRLASRVSVQAMSEMVAGQFSVLVVLVDGADARDAERAVHSVMATLLHVPIDPAEFERLRVQQVAGLQHTLTRLEAKAALLESGQLQLRDPDAYLNAARRLLAATPEAMQRATRPWLTAAAHVFEIEPYGTPAAQGNGPSRLAPPTVVASAPTFTFAPLSRGTFDNGLQVQGEPLPGELRFHARLAFDRGYLSEPAEAQGALAVIAAVHRFGIGARDAAALAAHLAEHGLSLGVSYDPSGFCIDIDGMDDGDGGGAEAALRLLAELVTSTRLDEPTFERYRVEETAQFDRLLTDPAARIGSLNREAIYGAGHPLLRPPAALRAALQTLTLAAVEAVRDRLFDPRHATLSWAGSAAFGTALAQALPAALRSWTGRGDPLDAPAVPTLPPMSSDASVTAENAAENAAEILLVDLPDSEQARLSAVLSVPAWGEVDETALLALNHVLGGGFGSRLNQSVREQHAWSYGIGSALDDPGVPGLPRLLQIQVALAAEHAAEAVYEIRAQMQALAGARPVTDAEIADFRHQELQRMQALRRDPAAWCGALDFQRRRGLPTYYWSEWVAAVQALQPAAVQALAQQLLAAGRSRSGWTLGGDAAALARQLAAAELPAHRVSVEPVDGAGTLGTGRP